MGAYARYADGSVRWREDLADPSDSGGSIVNADNPSQVVGSNSDVFNGSIPVGPGGNGTPGSQANPFQSGRSGQGSAGGGSALGGGSPLSSSALNDLPTSGGTPFQPVGQGATRDNFTFDPANASRAFLAGLQANGFDTLNPNGAAGVFTRRGSDFQRLFPLLAAIDPGTYGNANSVQDSQRFFGSLPNTFEALIRQDPRGILGRLFSNNEASSPLGQLQLYLGNSPDELANVLSAVTGLNASPYASNFFGNYLRNLVQGANSNAGLLNSHGGNLLGAVQELLNGVKTFQ